MDDLNQPLKAMALQPPMATVVINHTTLILFNVLFLMAVIPFVEMCIGFDDFGARLPWSTEFVKSLTTYAFRFDLNAFLLKLFLFVLVLSLDGACYSRAYKRFGETWARVWYYGWIAILSCLPVFYLWAILQPVFRVCVLVATA